jgi:hypothetical protein
MAKKKPFAGERFIFPDSHSLGRAPWDTHTHLQTGIRHTTGRNYSGFLSVSKRYIRPFTLICG